MASYFELFQMKVLEHSFTNILQFEFQKCMIRFKEYIVLKYLVALHFEKKNEMNKLICKICRNFYRADMTIF